MISFKDYILLEKIVGNTGWVYHRTENNPEGSEIVTQGIKPSTNQSAMYGRGLYCCYDLEEQFKEEMIDNYGEYILKGKIDLNGFAILDSDIYRLANPRGDFQSHLIKIGTSIDDIKYALPYTSRIAQKIWKNCKEKGYNGIIFTGQQDGKVAVIWNRRNFIPYQYTEDEGDTWERLNPNISSIKRKDDPNYDKDDEKLSFKNILKELRLKTEIGDLVIPNDYQGIIVLDKLKKCGKIDTKNIDELNLPQLQQSGNIYADHITKLNLPQLQKSGNITIKRLTELNLPKLKTSENIHAFKSTELNLPELEICWDIDCHNAINVSLQKLRESKMINLTNAKELNLPQLQKSTNINADSSTSINLPQLTKSSSINAKNAIELNLPQLQQAGHIFAFNVKEINLQQLTQSSSISVGNVIKLNLSQLQVSGSIDANNAVELNLSQLKISGGINANNVSEINLPQLNQLMGYGVFAKATKINLPQLEILEGGIRAENATELNLPVLKIVKNHTINVNSAKKITIPKNVANILKNVPKDCEIIHPEDTPQIKMDENTTFRDYFLLNEAIPLKQVKKKKLTRENSGAYKIEQLNTAFKGKDRLVYDIDVLPKDILTLEFPVLEEILKIVKEKLPDYTIPTKKSYIDGFIYKKEDTALKKPIKISKFLLKFQDDSKVSDVLKSFMQDPMRAATKNKNLKVVISRHPYDVAGMSTDRSWTSCMNMGTNGINYPSKPEGINRRFVANDISSGTIIAYLVSDDDRNKNGKLAIKRPLARMLMKPYVDTKDSNNHAYSVERVYGTPNSSFIDFVKNWVDTNINKEIKDKRFVLHGGLYYDGEPYKNFVGVRKEIEDMSNVFFSNLYRTSEEYFRNFIINTENDGFNTEIIIEFSFDNSIKMEDKTFESPNKLPKYVENIKDATEIKERSGFYGSQGVMFTRMEMHPEQDNLLRIEYVFRIPDIREDVDEKNQYDDPYIKDYIHETFETFMKECNFDDFDYGESYKRIKDILLNANPENEKEQEIQELTNKFKLVSDVNNPNSPIHRKSNEYNEYVKSLEKYVNAVSNLEKLEPIFDEKYTPDQVDTKIREYWNPNSVFVKSLNDIKKFKDDYQVIYKAMNAYQPSQSDFGNINVHNEWDNKIFQETMKISIDEIKNKLAKLEQTLMNTVTFIRLIRKHEESPELADIMFNVKSFQKQFDPYFTFYVSRW